MVDLARWLGEQLDTDAARAKAAGGDSWRRQDHPSETVAVYDSQGEPVVYDEGWPTEAQQEHIAEWDPARVLLGIDGKRRTLIRCQEEMMAGIPRLTHFAQQTLREMALEFSTRPGYAEAVASLD